MSANTANYRGPILDIGPVKAAGTKYRLRYLVLNLIHSNIKCWLIFIAKRELCDALDSFKVGEIVSVTTDLTDRLNLGGFKAEDFKPKDEKDHYHCCGETVTAIDHCRKDNNQ